MNEVDYSTLVKSYNLSPEFEDTAINMLKFTQDLLDRRVEILDELGNFNPYPSQVAGCYMIEDEEEENESNDVDAE